jgi:hypothetical protein
MMNLLDGLYNRTMVLAPMAICRSCMHTCMLMLMHKRCVESRGRGISGVVKLACMFERERDCIHAKLKHDCRICI